MARTTSRVIEGFGGQEEAPTPEDDQGELSQLIAELIAEIENATERLTMSKGELKRRGFKPLESGLATKFTLPSGTETPANHGDIRHVNTLVYLADLTDPTNSRDLLGLDEVRALEAVFRMRLNNLQSRVAKAGLVDKMRVNWPEFFQFGKMLDDIRERWTSELSQYVRELWPDAQGAEVAQRIETLLFPTAQMSLPGMSRGEALREVVVTHLNEVIFPRGKKMTKNDVTEMMQQHSEHQRQTGNKTTRYEVQWERIRDLVDICNQLGGELYETKADERIFGENVPWFVAILTLESGKKFIVAESPITESATYILPEYYEDYNWHDILTSLRRTETQDFGARAIVHSAKSPYGEGHVDKIVTTVRVMDRDT
jgi:hypothetical protein